MTDPATYRLFMLKGPLHHQFSEGLLPETNEAVALSDDDLFGDLLPQFSAANRSNAVSMALWYEAFYLLENHIRELVIDTLAESVAESDDWWELKVPQGVKDEADRNRAREEDSGMRYRSDRMIDYTTFGQLSDIIKDNWPSFAGILRNRSATLRVLSLLNSLRGPIAHCGVLKDDEVARLKVAIRDWFYLGQS